MQGRDVDIVQALKADYARFPVDQSFDLYAETVYFQDPLNSFRGVQRYRAMITFLQTWLQDIQLDLHAIDRDRQTIQTRWTLHFTAPLPWRPRVAIPGHSLLTLDDRDLIVAHLDVWELSRWQVLQQLWARSS